MDLNKVMIIGRLTRDPELRTTPGGANVCQLGIATSYVYTNQQTGQKVEQTEFHNVVLWRKLADIAAQYLKKGTQVFIEGRLQTRSWDDKTSGQKRYKTEIVGDNMIMLGRPAGASSSGSYSAPTPAPKTADTTAQPAPTEELPTIQQGEDINVEDIPF
jgi:single-strand DNA-binding protein